MSKPQLFCFTYAGGNRDFFNSIAKDLYDVDVCALEYAGHGIRHKEKFYDSFDELADDMFLQIKDRIYQEYSMFGYSMGSITLVEVLKRIIESKSPLPSSIFLAAHEPHTKSELIGFTSDELDNWVKERTIRFGGVPDKLLNNNAFWRMYLPLYRADYSLIGKYRFEDLSLTTDISATVFYSEEDTSLEEMKLWKQYFVGNCDFYRFAGTHFFINEHHEAMAKIIRDKLEIKI